MSFPAPVPGLVIRYAYLWRTEHLRGIEEGSKDRPCAVILTSVDEQGDDVVTVLPVTHAPPANAAAAVEIPAETKRRLGLDDQRSWVVVTEANVFAWPGPDLRALVAGRPETVAYGFLPRALFREIRDRFVRSAAAGVIVKRTE